MNYFNIRKSLQYGHGNMKSPILPLI